MLYLSCIFAGFLMGLVAAIFIYQPKMMMRQRIIWAYEEMVCNMNKMHEIIGK